MTRTVTAAFASFGLVISSAIAAIIVVGLLEGVATLPDLVPPAAGIAVFVGGLGLSGRVAVDVDPDHAVRAVCATAAVIAAGGLLAAQVTESQGEALEPITVVVFASGLLVLLAASAVATRRVRAARAVRT